jgi:hypothetical protein
MNTTTTALKGLRRVLVVIIIAAFAAAAAIGIWTIVTGGNQNSETVSKVLATTALIGGVSLTSLCHLAIIGRAIRYVGFVGLIASVATLVTGLMMIWQDWSATDNYEFMNNLGKAFQLSLVAAIFLAQVNLLLLLSNRVHRAIQISLYVTFAAIVVVYGLLAWGILGQDVWMQFPDMWKYLAIAAIIDALGTVVTPVLGLVLKKTEPQADGGAKVTVHLTAEQVLNLRAAHPEKSLDDALLAKLAVESN